MKILLSTLGAAALALSIAGCSKATEATGGEKTAANNAKKAETSDSAKTKPTAAEKKTESKTEKKEGIRSVDFLNYSYESYSCAEDLGLSEKIKVSKGKFKSGDNYFEVKDNNFMYAEVDGDGQEDAVVTIECGSSAGTFRSFEIHAFAYENGKAKTIAVLTSNQVGEEYAQYYKDSYVFGIPQNGVTVDNDGRLVADVLTDGSFAMPANVSTFTYALNGSQFVLTEKPTKRKYKP